MGPTAEALTMILDPTFAITGSASALALGVGLKIGARLFPAAASAARDLRHYRRGPGGEIDDQAREDEECRRLLARPEGRLRDSSIVGLYGDSLRHSDGSYTRAYQVEMSPTLFGENFLVEHRYDALARMLGARMTVGTVIQFRLSAGPDPGMALLAHQLSRDVTGINPLASLLHDGAVQKYARMAEDRFFRRTMLTLWVRVPNPSGRKQADEFLPTIKQEVKEHGYRHLLGSAARAWSASSVENILRRTLAEERASLEAADKTFRLIERECPLKLKRLTRDELWAAVFLSHRQNATSVPAPPADGRDIRDYLCGESIISAGHYVLHGVHPAAVITLFAPPQPYVRADIMRALSVNGNLNFRHTVIAEYVALDSVKAMKCLDRRIRQVRRSMIGMSGRVRESPEARVSLDDLRSVREEIAGGREALTALRLYALVYGEPSRTPADLRESLKGLDRHCEQLITEIRKLSGADADREEPSALRALYHRSLAGEADARPTGREIKETVHSLSVMIPTECEWGGAKRPHTLVSLPTGKLIGLDFFDRAQVPSPLILALAAPRGGKSVFLGRIINDVLATKRSARVRAIDFGESFAPLVDTLEGRHLRFDLSEERTINVFDYDDLGQFDEKGEPFMPDDIQIAYVVGDLMQLARVPENDTIAEDILTTVASEVYRNEVPRNRPGEPKHEPVLSHVIDLLSTYPFQGTLARDRAETLKMALSSFQGHPFLDAPTHPDFAAESSLDVYELDSLEQFPQRVQESLAYRAAARVTRAIGELQEDGTRCPTLLVFDEVWKIVQKYPRILNVIKRGARQGGKENVVTMLASQAYEDFETLPDITKTAGVRLIGKQIGDYTRLAQDSGLSEHGAAAISVINNVPGSHAQFVCVFGAGEDKVVELIQVDLSPTELWTFTTNPDERNARARVSALRPEWPLAMVIQWLARNYPRGLTGADLTSIDESLVGPAA